MNLRADIRYALRGLRRTPVFTLAAVSSLALGIGANTAIFSLLDQVLLRTLPVQNPQELVVFRDPGPRSGLIESDAEDAQVFSYPLYKDLRDRSEAFSGVLARFSFAASVAHGGSTERAAGELVSGNYFDVLGARAAIGRTLTPEDDHTPGADHVVMLSHSYWTRRFGSNPAVLNQKVTVNSQPMTVVGVAQPGFFGVQIGRTPDVFVPMAMKAAMTPNWDGLSQRNHHWLNIIARLKPRITRERAAASLQPLYTSLLRLEAEEMNLPAERRERYLGRRIGLAEGSQGRPVMQRETKAPLLFLMGMAAFVLLIACANTANLLLARSASRQREIAVRLAIGAGRGQIVRQLLVESVVLALASGAAGLLVASWTLGALIGVMPPDGGLSKLSPELDPRILLFTLGLSVVTGLLFGLFPALDASRANLTPALKDHGGAGSGQAQARFRKSLITAQVALTSLLLIGAGLFAKSLHNLRSVDLGVRTDRMITFSLSPELSGYGKDRTLALYAQLEERLRALPGVQAVGAAEVPVFANSNLSSNYTVQGFAGEGTATHLSENSVNSGYFSAMGIPLVSGREFTPEDAGLKRKAAIINESAARHFFAGRNPLGFRVVRGAGQVIPDTEIVGVVRDSRHAKVKQAAARFIYFPYRQKPAIGRMAFYVRAAQDTGQLSGAVRAVVRGLDAALPVYNLRTMAEQVDENLLGERLLTMLTSAFGTLAALLAALGIYGMLAYSVERRIREIGIRMALGARSGAVRWLVVREIGILAMVGAALGLAGAYALGRYVQSLLFDLKPNNPLIWAGAIAGVLLITLLAAYFPTRRATRVDPMVALRYE